MSPRSLVALSLAVTVGLAGAAVADTSRPARIKLAASVVNRKLTAVQAKAVMKAHFIGARQPGKDGSPARVGNYTTSQLLQKDRILARAGFAKTERRALMKAGVAGVVGTRPALGPSWEEVAPGLWKSRGEYYQYNPRTGGRDLIEHGGGPGYSDQQFDRNGARVTPYGPTPKISPYVPTFNPLDSGGKSSNGWQNRIIF